VSSFVVSLLQNHAMV